MFLEVIMLVCFGSAWPFSIYKSFVSKKNHGKSFLFMFIIFIGYISGSLHKLFYSYDPTIYLYILNALLVFIDMCIYIRNKKYSPN